MPHPETAAWKLFPELGGGIGYAEGLGFRAFVAHRDLPGCASSSLRASGAKTGVFCRDDGGEVWRVWLGGFNALAPLLLHHHNSEL